MAVNAFRFDPSAWLVHIQEAYDSNPLLRKSVHRKGLEDFISKMGKLPAIPIDDAANEAARINNSEVVAS